MQKPARGIELFELLAEQRARGRGLQRTPEADEPAPPTGPQPRPVIRSPRTGSEIVFSLNTAFVLFVAVLILCGSAYVIGHQNGRRDEQNRAFKDGPMEIRPDAESYAGIEGRPIHPTLAVTGAEFTLKLTATQKKTEEDLAKLRHELAFAAAQAPVREANLEAFVFDSGGVYTLGVGLFERKDDPTLLKLQRFFAASAGPAIARRPTPYRDCAPAQTKDLGPLAP